MAVTARTIRQKGTGIVNDPTVPGLRWHIGKRVATARISPWIDGKQANVKVATVSKDAPLADIGRQLKDIRARAWQIKTDAAAGIDPAERTRRERRAAQLAKQNTFAAAWNRSMEARTDHADYKEQIRKGEQEILPVLGAIPLAELTRNDVLDYLLQKRRKSLSQAINQYRLINAVLNEAVDRGDVDLNVATRLQKRIGKLPPRERYLSTAEILAFWTKLPHAGMTPQIRLILQLCLVTLQRRDEVRLMRHEELDRENSCWEFASERTKAGRRHRVHLSPLAWEIIDAAGTSSGYVFAYPDGNPPAGSSVSQAMKLARPVFGVEDITVHDLRRTGATHLGDMGAPPYVVSRLLNHAVSGVTETHYLLSLYGEERRLALERWSNRLVEIVTGQPAPSNVEQLRAAR